MLQKIFSVPVFLFFVLFFAHFQSFSQDRIILNSGDTIHCTIGKITRKYISYSQRYDGITAKGKIDKSKVNELTFQTAVKPPPDRVKVAPVIKEHLIINDTVKTVKPEKNKFRASVSGGVGHISGSSETAEQNLVSLGASAADASDYYKSLKTGYIANASAYYQLTRDYWLGLLYQGFYTTSEMFTPLIMDDSNMYYGRAGERIFVNFNGVSLYSSSLMGKNKKLGLNTSFTVGPAFYRNETEIFNEQILFKGSTLGTNFAIGAEYFIKPALSMYMESSYFMAKIRKVNITTIDGTQEIEFDENNIENLGRLNLSLGVVFYW